MKWVKYLIICIIISFFSTSVVNAEMCDLEDVSNMKELIKNISIDYEYKGDIELAYDLQAYDVWFDFGDLEGKVYITDSFSLDSNKVRKSSERLRVQSGKRTFYVYYDNCAGLFLGTIEVELKYFNDYYLRNDCIDLWDKLDVCDMWYQGNISDRQFESAIENYHKGNDKVDITSMSISDIVKTYYFYFIGVCVFLICLIVFLVVRHIKSSRLD